jgi:hypothetical protein
MADAVRLDTLPADVLLLVLRRCGARGVAACACACARLRSAQRQLADAPAFAAALAPMGPGRVPALAAAAARAALAQALERMVSSVAFALVLVAPPHGSAYGSCEAAVAAVQLRLPAGCVILGVTGAAVAGPLVGACGAAAERTRAVCVLLGSLPAGHTATITRDGYPAALLPRRRGNGERCEDSATLAPADARIAAWLRAPAATAPLLWCAHFLRLPDEESDGESEEAVDANAADGERAQSRAAPLPFHGAPHISRAFPAAALVGGIAAGGAAASLVVAVAAADLAAHAPPRCVAAAALSVFGPAATHAPARAHVSAAAVGVRGVVPLGACWTVDALAALGAAADGFEPIAVQTAHRVLQPGGDDAAPAPPGDAPPGDVVAEAAAAERSGAARRHDMYLRVWQEEAGAGGATDGTLRELPLDGAHP